MSVGRLEARHCQAPTGRDLTVEALQLVRWVLRQHGLLLRAVAGTLGGAQDNSFAAAQT